MKPVYALRHIATGLFMPCRMTPGLGRGWSHWEPIAKPAAPFDTNPRIFISPRAANHAIFQWARGPAADDYDGEGNRVNLDRRMKPLTPRLPTDIELVAFNLVEIK